MKLGELDILMVTLVNNHPIELLHEAEIVVTMPHNDATYAVQGLSYNENTNTLTVQVS